MLSFLYVYSDHSSLECYNLFSGVELSMRSFFVIWSSLTTKVKHSNPTDGSHMSDFLVNLEQYQKDLSLIGCLLLPFDSATIMTITRFVASVVAKIYRLRTEKLGELEAPWIAK